MSLRLQNLIHSIGGSDRHGTVMIAPRCQIVNRSGLLKEVETDSAALVEFVNDMDDLVLQFAETDPSKRFQEAWNRARIIVEVGGGQGGEDKATSTLSTIQPK